LIYRTKSRKVFEAMNYTFFILFTLSIILPFLYVISLSLSSYEAINTGKVGLIPVGFSLAGYKNIIQNSEFIRALFNTIFITAIDTILVIWIALMAGYALANKNMPGKNIIFNFILLPLYLNGGLIPYYLLVNSLKLKDSYLAIIFPIITNVFYIIVYRNSIVNLPHDIIESAEIDGAGEYRILYSIVLPLLLPMTMAFIIFSAVAYWNEWYNVLLFISSRKKWTLQYKLRDILATNDLTENSMKIRITGGVHPKNIRMAALMVTVLPIVTIYPFLQKYFIHGIIVGAVKG